MKKPSPTRFPRAGLTGYIEEHLRTSIIRGELKPGTHLVEAKIAEELGVSNTPVREAIRSLARDGLVEILPYRGSFVREITEQFINEVVSLRTRIEVFALELALSKMTTEDFDEMEAYAREMEQLTQAGDHFATLGRDVAFHSIIFERAGHRILWDVWEFLQPQVQLVQAYGRLYASPLPQGHVERNHLELVEVFRTGDLERATEAVRNHCDIGRQLILAHRNRMGTA